MICLILSFAVQSFFLVGGNSLRFLVKSWSPCNESWKQSKI